MSQVCADCRTDNRSDAKFCRGCGRRLALVAASRTPLAPVGGEDWAATLRMPFEAESGDPADLAEDSPLMPLRGRPSDIDPAPPSRRVPAAKTAPLADPDFSLPATPRRRQRSQSRTDDLLPPLSPPNPLRRVTLGLLLLALLVGGTIWWLQRAQPGRAEAPSGVVASTVPPATETAPATPATPATPAAPAAPAPAPAPASAEAAPAAPVTAAPLAAAAAAGALAPALAAEEPSKAEVAAPAPAAQPAPPAAAEASTAKPAPTKPVVPPAHKPRKPAPAAVAAAPPPAAAPAPEPVAPPAPPPPPSLQSVCGSLNFFSRSRCMVEQCGKADYKGSAECSPVRRQQEIEEEKRNPQQLH